MALAKDEHTQITSVLFISNSQKPNYTYLYVLKIIIFIKVNFYQRLILIKYQNKITLYYYG